MEDEGEEIPVESEADDAQSRFTIKSKNISRKHAKAREDKTPPQSRQMRIDRAGGGGHSV